MTECESKVLGPRRWGAEKRLVGSVFFLAFSSRSKTLREISQLVGEIILAGNQIGKTNDHTCITNNKPTV